MRSDLIERRECPAEFQEAIDERFGLNRFGGPNYKLVWGETEMIRVAGLHGYEERPLCGNVPCWNILRWRPPEAFGSPKLYDLTTRDPETGLCILGEFPYEGRYDVLQQLMAKEMQNGRLIVDAFPLSYLIIESILPLCEIAREMTEDEVLAANAVLEAQENKAVVDEITDRLMEQMPTRFGPVSYSKQGCRTAVIDKKMAEISRVWNRMSKTELRRQRSGFYQGNPN